MRPWTLCWFPPPFATPFTCKSYLGAANCTHWVNVHFWWCDDWQWACWFSGAGLSKVSIVLSTLRKLYGMSAFSFALVGFISTSGISIHFFVVDWLMWVYNGLFFWFKDFLSEIKKHYKAELDSVDFQTKANDSRVLINSWVEKQTQGSSHSDSSMHYTHWNHKAPFQALTIVWKLTYEWSDPRLPSFNLNVKMSLSLKVIIFYLIINCSLLFCVICSFYVLFLHTVLIHPEVVMEK